jgi:hypothetical protein
MDKTTFCAILLAMIEQGASVFVTVSFEMGEAKPYLRQMEVLSMRETGEGYECVVKGYGLALISFGATFSIRSP